MLSRIDHVASKVSVLLKPQICYIVLCIHLKISQGELFEKENKAANERNPDLLLFREFAEAKLTKVITALSVVLKLSKYSLPNTLYFILFVDSHR